MRSVLETLTIFLLLALLTLLIAFVLSAGVLLIGWVLARLFPLSLFEAAAIALLPSMVALYTIWRVWTTMGEMEEAELEEERPPVSLRRRPRRRPRR
ncbi:MAG TPA: hypothetical protein EYP55_04420 [Anaerolineae bacterium]|nr:hypothetical protein [Anaerolineae bacterium]